MIAFLCWSASANTGQPVSLLGLLQSTVFLAVPLILGALSGILCERTGVINIAIEGQFLVGAFAASLATSMAGSFGVGIAAAVIAGGLIGALLAVFAIRYLVNQVVLGVVINLLALGLTGLRVRRADADRSEPVQQRARSSIRSRSRCSATSRSSGRCCSTPTSSST